MNRRSFIRAVVALPIVASLPALASTPIREELLRGITYISQNFYTPNGAFIESWRKVGGKIYRMVNSEDKIISVTEEPYCPYFMVPTNWTTV